MSAKKYLASAALSILIVFDIGCWIPYTKIKQINAKDPFNKSEKYILLWNKYWDSPTWDLEPRGDVVFGPEYFKQHNCSVPSCYLTFDHSLLPSVADFDAILFHRAQALNIFKPIPTERSPHQKYIFAMNEPPGKFRFINSRENGFYNWTMTYRQDSDIYWGYGYIKHKKTGRVNIPSSNTIWIDANDNFYDENLLQKAKAKKNMAAWFVSNCNPTSNRMQFYKKLKKFISIDAYGLCGDLHCLDNCDELKNNYKFYLALENSFCQDYVTEKLFSNLKQNIIPIVYGASAYDKFAPPKSYINANDFDTVKDLADYLIYLDQNPKEYIKYFWWKEHYEVFSSVVQPFCQICEKLHHPSVYQKREAYGEIESWWENYQCNKKPNIKL